MSFELSYPFVRTWRAYIKGRGYSGPTGGKEGKGIRKVALMSGHPTTCVESVDWSPQFIQPLSHSNTLDSGNNTSSKAPITPVRGIQIYNRFELFIYFYNIAIGTTNNAIFVILAVTFLNWIKAISICILKKNKKNKKNGDVPNFILCGLLG